MRNITRRNLLAAAAASAGLAGLAACDTGGGDEEESAFPAPAADSYPIDPDGDDVEALWASEEVRDGWTRVTNPEGGAELGVMDASRIIQVDGLAFRDCNGNGKLDLYEDWRQSAEDRAASLASSLTPEEIYPLMFNNGLMSSSAPLDDDTIETLTQGMRAGITRSTPTVDNYASHASWVNAIEEWCEKNDPNGIPYLNGADPYFVNGMPNYNGLAASFDLDLIAENARWMAKAYRHAGIRVMLGPQLDIQTHPTWTRLSGAISEDPLYSTDFGKYYIGAMQSTYDEDGNDIGWGADSCAIMAKHYCGAGAAEGGRNDHNAYAKYCVFPGKNFHAHLVPFIDGGMHLESATGYMASVMPNYGIAYSEDEEYGELVGGGFSKYKIDFLRNNGYDGMVTTDWGIVTTRYWGMEDATELEREVKILEAGCDQIGGEFTPDMASDVISQIKADLGDEEGEKLFTEAGRRILTTFMHLDLFDNPYTDREQAKAAVVSEDMEKFALDTQVKCVIMLKNKGNVIKERSEKPRVYVPLSFTEASQGFSFPGMPAGAMAGMPSADPTPASWDLPVEREVLEQYFDLVTDTVLDPSGEPDEDGNATYTENDCQLATAEEIADCDFAFLIVDGPQSGIMQEGYDSSTNTYLPISLQYKTYTADGPHVRQTSIAGDLQEDGTRENCSYYGQSITVSNSDTLDDILELKERIGELPLVLGVSTNNPMVFSEFEDKVEGILLHYGGEITDEAVCVIASGQVEPTALLTSQMPASMDAVEASDEDVPRDMECHVDSEGNAYDFAFGMNWSGVIDDERTQRYKAEPLTKPETIEV